MNRYSEAIDLLYSCNAFVYRNLTAITLFTSTVLPQRLRCIRLLRLEWIFQDYAIDYPYGTSAAYSEPVHASFDGRWEALWELFSTRMTGLRDLYVRLEGDFRYGPTAWEERIFGPMQRMKGPRTLEVEVNWMPRVDLTGLSQVKVVSSTSKGQHWED
ncbi:hypothetical protein BJX66DRAFT_319502 [Aspergillus keveii]|uniref:DUF7730 domain-containing protein n=1 Tax=Aspergillus keveii TaxID=714993 RepID=A0ABR4FIL5_9EURO